MFITDSSELLNEAIIKEPSIHYMLASFYEGDAFLELSEKIDTLNRFSVIPPNASSAIEITREDRKLKGWARYQARLRQGPKMNERRVCREVSNLRWICGQCWRCFERFVRGHELTWRSKSLLSTLRPDQTSDLPISPHCNPPSLYQKQ
jgi:hypothetical protein